MAIAVTPNLTDVSMCDALTGWTAVGGANALNDPTVFDSIQGSYCIQNYNAAAVNRGADFTYATDQVLTNKNIYMWFATSRTAGFQVKGANGMRIRVEDLSGNWAEWDIFGSDTLPHGGWICWSVAVNSTTASRTGGTFPTLTAIRKIGWRANSIAGKTYIYWDAVRFGTGLTVTSGATDAIGFEEIYAIDNNSTYKYGVVSRANGIYIIQGTLIFGDSVGTDNIDFDEVGQIVVFPSNEYYLDNTNTIQIVGNSTGVTNFVLSGSFIKSNLRRFLFDADDANIDTFELDGNTFVDAGLINFKSGQSILSCVFDNCLQITPSTSTFQNNTIKNSVATDGAILFPTDDTNIKNLVFINNDLGVEYDSTSDTSSPKFDNFSFDDVSGNYDVNNTSGGAITIAIINTVSGGANSYTGSSVTFTSDPVTTKITAKDINTSAVVEGARVFLEAAEEGDLNYQHSVSLSRSGTTVTVSHTGHGLTTGAMVHISGATEPEYNGVHTITYIGVDSYSYEISTTPTSPATGSPVSTTVLFNTLTNSSGYVSDIRVFSASQAVIGRVRKSSGVGTLYKSQPISGTISSAIGLDLTVFLIEDE